MVDQGQSRQQAPDAYAASPAGAGGASG